ncbi:MAG: dipeptidase [Promethearchaeota archaeon]
MIDGHSDYAQKIYVEYKNGNLEELLKGYYPSLIKGGVKIVALQVGGDFSTMGYDLRDYDIVNEVFEVVLDQIHQSKEKFQTIKSKKDLDTVLANNKIGMIFSIEGSGSIDQNLVRLDELYQKGLRMLALTHNSQNIFAQGCFLPETGLDSGLSPLGKKLIAKLNQLDIIFDIVHASEKTFWNALDLIEKPPIVSHSNCKALCDTSRNLTDEQIRAIGDQKGVIGINFIKMFLDSNPKKATLERVIDHIDHIVNITDIKNVGLGPDFYKYLWPGLEHIPEIEEVSEMQKIIPILENRGYSKEDIQKICFHNFYRVFKENLR